MSQGHTANGEGAGVQACSFHSPRPSQRGNWQVSRKAVRVACTDASKGLACWLTGIISALSFLVDAVLS